MPYFDHNATTPLHPLAETVWLETARELFANPSSPHRTGARARNRLEQCREEIAELFNVLPDRIVFNSGATEGNNAVLEYLARISNGRRLLCSSIEHPSVKVSGAFHFGECILSAPVGMAGILEIGPFEQALEKGPIGAISVMAANNETGVVQPWKKVVELGRTCGIPVHIDAVQWIGKMPLDGVDAADFVTASAHKFGGPKGVGFLILSNAVGSFRGQLGGEQENSHRAGTENLPAIAAMTAMLQLRYSSPMPESRLQDGLVSRLEAMGAEVVGRDSPRLWNTVSAIMPRFDRSRWIAKLDRKGFEVSSGSACATGKDSESSVLRVMGYDSDVLNRVLRFSSGHETSVQSWDALTEAVGAVWQELSDEPTDSGPGQVIEI